MRLTIKICKIILILLGSFMIMMSFDVFDSSDETIWMLIAGFLIHASPGIILIALTLILWNKEKWLGVLIIIGAVGLFFLFKLYIEFNEKWLTFLTIEVPLFAVGGLLLGYKKK